MDELTRYAADVIEFIAGGILFLTALLIWGYLFIPETMTTVIFPFAVGLGDVSSLALGIGLLGITYTLGVFAEGASRVVAEWRLRRLTCETMREEYDLIPTAVSAALVDARLGRSGATAQVGRLLRSSTCAGCRQAHSMHRQAQAQDEPVAESTSASELCGKHRSAAENRVKQGLIEQKREEWRSIGSQSPSGAKSIDAQLKRLRIERTLLLSIALITLGLAVRAATPDQWLTTLGRAPDPTVLWILAGAGAVLAAMCAFLVNERFRRFLDTIARAHALEVARK